MSDSSNKKEKRIEILKVAKRIFAHYGFKKTSMDDIAVDMGLAKTSLYYYFKSKNKLFKAVIEYESEILLAKLKEEVDKQDSPEEKIKSFFITRMEYLKNFINLYKLTTTIAKEVLSHAEETRIKFIDAEKKIILEILNMGLDKEIFEINNPELVALGLIASIKGLESSILSHEDRDIISSNFEEMLVVLLHGIIKK